MRDKIGADCCRVVAPAASAERLHEDAPDQGPVIPFHKQLTPAPGPLGYCQRSQHSDCDRPVRAHDDPGAAHGTGQLCCRPVHTFPCRARTRVSCALPAKRVGASRCRRLGEVETGLPRPGRIQCRSSSDASAGGDQDQVEPRPRPRTEPGSPPAEPQPTAIREIGAGHSHLGPVVIEMRTRPGGTGCDRRHLKKPVGVGASSTTSTSPARGDDGPRGARRRGQPAGHTPVRHRDGGPETERSLAACGNNRGEPGVRV